MATTHPELLLVGHGNAVTALAFSADGKTLISGSYDRTAIVWDVETGKMQRLLRLKDFVNSLILTPDGTLLVTDDGQVWDVRTGKRLRASSRYMAPLACSPDGRTLACATYLPNTEGAHLLLTDIRTGRTRLRFPCCEQQLHSLAFSSDGELVAVSGYDSQVSEGTPYITTICNLRTGETRSWRQQSNVSLFGIKSETDIRLVAVSPDGIQLWNAETGEALKTIVEPHSSYSAFETMSVSLSPDGKWLAVGSDSGHLSVWNVATSERLWQTQAHRGWLRVIAFTSDGRMLATAGNDQAIRLWDALGGTPRRVLGGCDTSVEAVAFSADGQAITSLHDDGTARLWRIAPPSCEKMEKDTFGVLTWRTLYKPDTARNFWDIAPITLPTDADMPGGFTIGAISPDGLLVALHQADRDISIWNREEHAIQSTLRDAASSWGALAFSPDNRYLASNSESGDKILLFNAQTGELWREFPTEDKEWFEAHEFAFSPDSRLLAAGHTGYAVTLWDTQTGKLKRVLLAHGDGVNALAFSPDSKTLAVGTAYEETVWLRCLRRGKKNVCLKGHTNDIRSVDFAPDGTSVVTGAEDGTVRLWEAESGKLLATFQALPDAEWAIFTPEGSFLNSPGAQQYFLYQDGENLVPADTF